jgi:hypothetical protein
MTALSPAVALEHAQAAKAAYRDDPHEGTRAGHRAASAELRYARWIARGGPQKEAARIAAANAVRLLQGLPELDPGEGHTNGEIAMMFARWVESREG